MKRKVSNFQIGIASLLGIFGGLYIWKPVFESLFTDDQRKTVVTGDNTGVS